jgi:hypothetical protein
MDSVQWDLSGAATEDEVDHQYENPLNVNDPALSGPGISVSMSD